MDSALASTGLVSAARMFRRWKRAISEADFKGAWTSFTVQSNMQRADDLVRRYRVEGVPTTIPMHVQILGSAAFRSGGYDTRSIPGWP